MAKLFSRLFIALCLIILGVFVFRHSVNQVAVPSPTPIVSARASVSSVVTRTPTATPRPSSAPTAILNAPFIPQAPLGNWSDPRQQNGCEEASLLMAIGWITGERFTLTENEKRITDFADWQIARYGFSTDTNAEDTAQLMRDYLHYDKIRVVHDISTADIRRELERGHLVIVPANGQRLGNPNFTSPGPLTHMYPILGYDSKTDEFITNDPGTRRGAGYRYANSVVENSLQDYPTGAEHGVQIPGKTAMIVVEK